MRPAELLFGAVGVVEAQVVFGPKSVIICRNGMTKKISSFEVHGEELAEKVQQWIADGKPGLIQDVFPELTTDQREQMISGITPDEWKEMF